MWNRRKKNYKLINNKQIMGKKKHFTWIVHPKEKVHTTDCERTFGFELKVIIYLHILL